MISSPFYPLLHLFLWEIQVQLLIEMKFSLQCCNYNTASKEKERINPDVLVLKSPPSWKVSLTFLVVDPPATPCPTSSCVLTFPGILCRSPQESPVPLVYNSKSNAVHHDWLWVSFAIIKDSENVFKLRLVKSSAAPGPWQQSVIGKEWKNASFSFS